MPGAKNSKKWLFVRVDRMGDLAVTLPVDQGLEWANVTWMIAKGLEFLPQNTTPRRRFYSVPLRPAFKTFLDIIKWIKVQNFDGALVYHAPWWIGLALWVAAVPVRTGRLSQWHHFLFLNSGVRQSRKDSTLHELEYNFELTEKCLKTPLPRTYLQLRAPAGDSPITESLLPSRYSVVHAGMAGSARNWSVEGYETLIREMLKDGAVVATGTAVDSKYLEPLKAKLKDQSVLWLDGQLSLTDLLRVLARAESVVAPSTGVVHLAASLGVPTVGLYSPVKVQSPKRWSPLGTHVEVLVPDVDCPGTQSCHLERCPKYDCMIRIQPRDVLAAITRAKGADHGSTEIK